MIEVSVLDPLGELDTECTEAFFHSDSLSTASLCCPACRRPFAIDLALHSPEQRTVRLRVRNEHDARGEWVAVSSIDALLPAPDGFSRALCACPNCRREVTLELRGVKNSSKVLSAQDSGSGGFAYATLLYGSGMEYVIGALVLGWTLLRPVLQPERGTIYRRILLHTSDVPDEYLRLLSQFWELRQVDYLTGSTTMYYNYSGSRFKEVFTKLQALNLLDFSKVLMLDNDLIVRRNIDELFCLEAPAALKRPGGRDQPCHGGRFRAHQLWDWRRVEAAETARSSDVDGWRYDMMSGINAGVMLLRPDRIVYQRMLMEIADHDHPEHLDCYGPEQEYLGRFFSAFGPGWTHMDARFNYQPLLGRGANRFMRSLDGQREVAIAHFSGPRVKPWAGLVSRHRKLDPESLRRLLEEAPDAFQLRFPENPRLPATGSEKYGEHGFPTLVVVLVREWAVELRRVALHLQEHSLDLLMAAETVCLRENSLLWRVYKKLPALVASASWLESPCRTLSVRSTPMLALTVLILGVLGRIARRGLHHGVLRRLFLKRLGGSSSLR
eukprot:TRINITY_DN20981_c0_g1_i2.p1 TRINITY_DN20981_c0_g1~~TRINITY_DN20981_c0_g1_i2.p1  ORF type:complete len:554 (-),score=88.69 TRINITY_DN20981_c0_g1_i2:133-1794(-)